MPEEPFSWDQFYRGVRLAAEEINAQGGVLGKTIELFPTDDQVKVDVGVSEMKKLILRDRVPWSSADQRVT